MLSAASGANSTDYYYTYTNTWDSDASSDTLKPYGLHLTTLISGAWGDTNTTLSGYVFLILSSHGQYVVPDFPTVGNVLTSDTVNGVAGTYHAPDQGEVLDSATYGANSGTSGTYHAPAASEVIHTAVFGVSSGTSGTYHAPEANEVWYGAAVGATTGTKRASSITNCSAGNVKKDVVIDDVTGTYEGGGGTTVIVVEDD